MRKFIFSTLFSILVAQPVVLASDFKSVRIQDINKNPSKWMNKEVTVQGQVVRLSPDSLVLDGAGIFNDRILVIDGTKMKNKGKDKGIQNAERAVPAEAMKMNAELRLTGTIRELTLSEVRDSYYAHPDEEVTSEFSTSMPVIVTNFATLSAIGPNKGISKQ
jgi:hypothetical protein